MYEGQSMIRSLIPEEKGKDLWQFTVMNTDCWEGRLRVYEGSPWAWESSNII